MTAPVQAVSDTATVVCAACRTNPETSRAEAHGQAAAHRDETGHRTIVIEIKTTAYEVSQ